MVTKVEAKVGERGVSREMAWLASWCATLSGWFTAIGLVFLVLFFTLGGVFGPLNDVAVILQYSLMIPLAVYFWRVTRQEGSRAEEVTLVIGIVGILGVICLQSLLVARVMPFQVQIFFLVPFFFVGAAWFVRLARTESLRPLVPGGLLLAVGAGLVIGYPFWAFPLGRRIRAGVTLDSI